MSVERCVVCNGVDKHQTIRQLDSHGWHIVDCPAAALTDKEIERLQDGWTKAISDHGKERAELEAELARLREQMRDWEKFRGPTLTQYWESLQVWKKEGRTHAEGSLVKRDYAMIERMIMARAALEPTTPPSGEK